MVEVRSAVEQAVWDRFMAAGYQAFGCCQNPGCESPGSVVMVCGRTPRARVCLICFEFDFDCVHPTQRAIDGRRRRR